MSFLTPECPEQSVMPPSGQSGVNHSPSMTSTPSHQSTVIYFTAWSEGVHFCFVSGKVLLASGGMSV